MINFNLQTPDAVTLAVTLFKPEISNKKLLLINSATGVKQQFYYGFAKYFQDLGFTVITYDYRGIGHSKPENLKNFNASMRIWGSLDYKTVTEYIQENFLEYQKFALGHSVGALILGMNPHSQIFDKFIFYGTQHTYLGPFNFKLTITAYIGFGFLQPLFTEILGYFPAHWFGMGERLPKDVAYDWRDLILNKESINYLLNKTEDFSKTLQQEVLFLHADDDSWIYETGMKNLMKSTYSYMKPQYYTIQSKETASKDVGHINFFRSKNKEIWKICRDYLMKN